MMGRMIKIVIAAALISAISAAAQEQAVESVDIAADTAIDTALVSTEEGADTSVAAVTDTSSQDQAEEPQKEPRVPRPALFLGITDPAGQPAQSELEQAVRGVFAVDQTFLLIDKLETERIIREKNRLGRGRLDNFIPEHFNLSDTAVIIRGIVEDFGMELKRRRFFWSRIDARMTVKFFFLNRQGVVEHQGEFSAAARKNKEFVFFLSPKKVVHISALDREEILKGLRAKLVTDIVTAAAQHFNPPPPEPEPEPESQESVDGGGSAEGAGPGGEPSAEENIGAEQPEVAGGAE